MFLSAFIHTQKPWRVVFPIAFHAMLWLEELTPLTSHRGDLLPKQIAVERPCPTKCRSSLRLTKMMIESF